MYVYNFFILIFSVERDRERGGGDKRLKENEIIYNLFFY